MERHSAEFQRMEENHTWKELALSIIIHGGLTLTLGIFFFLFAYNSYNPVTNAFVFSIGIFGGVLFILTALYLKIGSQIFSAKWLENVFLKIFTGFLSGISFMILSFIFYYGFGSSSTFSIIYIQPFLTISSNIKVLSAIGVILYSLTLVALSIYVILDEFSILLVIYSCLGLLSNFTSNYYQKKVKKSIFSILVTSLVTAFTILLFILIWSIIIVLPKDATEFEYLNSLAAGILFPFTALGVFLFKDFYSKKLKKASMSLFPGVQLLVGFLLYGYEEFNNFMILIPFAVLGVIISNLKFN